MQIRKKPASHTGIQLAEHLYWASIESSLTEAGIDLVLKITRLDINNLLEQFVVN